MKKLHALGAALLISFSITGCTLFPTPSAPPAPKPGNAVEEPQEKEVSLTFYLPSDDALNLIPKTVRVKTKDSLPKAALTEMIAAERKQSYPILPKGLSVLSVEVKDGLAIANFSKELADIDKSTSTEELFTAMTVNTLTEFPDIKEVKFLMDGKPITRLSGHSDMTRSFKRIDSIIKKQ